MSQIDGIVQEPQFLRSQVVAQQTSNIHQLKSKLKVPVSNLFYFRLLHYFFSTYRYCYFK
ncbi:hypothetical protein [Aliikangiella sp. IMCC44359]|uniref:hypothetical protein n=1 Tax=Aliikangiella sp. IMCC44359 TaxID=3459125 RepID=UPI00403B23DA